MNPLIDMGSARAACKFPGCCAYGKLEITHSDDMRVCTVVRACESHVEDLKLDTWLHVAVVDTGLIIQAK